MMKIKKLVGVLSLCGVASFGIHGQAWALTDLPTAQCDITQQNLNCLQFGDFNVYSLAYLNYLATGSTNLISQDPYYVRSSGQPINDSLVVASSPSVRRDNTDLGLNGFVDNGYNSPNDVPGAEYEHFIMSGSDPIPNPGSPDNRNMTQQVINSGSVPTYDNDTNKIAEDSTVTVNKWDISMSALQDFLNGDADNEQNALVFFFNLNENNKDETYPGGVELNAQDMYAWLQVTLTKTVNGVEQRMYFTMNGNTTSGFPDQGADQTANADEILPSGEKWVHVHGEICESETYGLIALKSCTLVTDDDTDFLELQFGKTYAQLMADAVTVNQNLGDQKAAFALNSTDLDDEVWNGGWDMMSVDLRMAYINNGYEQLFIQALNRTVTVPEPASLALLGIGLLGLGMAQRKSRKTA